MDKWSISHILIAYEGAERSEETRSKEEAEALANTVLAQVLADPANFAELAQQYSVGPSATKGGDLDFFTRGVMAPAFEEAAFKVFWYNNFIFF